MDVLLKISMSRGECGGTLGFKEKYV